MPAKCSADSAVKDRREARKHIAPEITARRLSCIQPAQSPEVSLALDDPVLALVRYTGEHGALPVDLAALLLGCSESEVEKNLLVRSIELGLLRIVEYVGEPNLWMAPRTGVEHTGLGVVRRENPAYGLLEHRRKTIAVRLLYREEMPDWVWVCEAAFRSFQNQAGVRIPDGALVRNGEMCVLEVERSGKESDDLFEKLTELCVQYPKAKVVYFCSRKIRKTVERFERMFPNLEVRSLPDEESPQWASSWMPYTPSRRAKRLLAEINEEGFVYAPQLPRLLGWSEPVLKGVLEEVEDAFCIRRGHEQNEDGGFVCCNYRGAARSGTDLAPGAIPSLGERGKRIVRTEVRFDVLARWPEATSWRTLRRLRQGNPGAKDLPYAEVERGGLLYAVVVLDKRPYKPKEYAAMLKRWKRKYAGVLCYRVKKAAPLMGRLLKEHELDEWVKVRDLPKPPKGSAYRSLEDEWCTGKQPFELTPEQFSVLQTVAREGVLGVDHVGALLGFSKVETDRLVRSLIDEKCFISEGKWVRCNGHGITLSKTGLSRPRAHSEASREGNRELVEIHLDLIERCGSIGWQTKREAAHGVHGSAGMPHSVATIKGQEYAIGIFDRGDIVSNFVGMFTRWMKQCGAAKCYCESKDIAYFKKILAKYGLHEVEVELHPQANLKRRRALGTDWAARDRKRRSTCQERKNRARGAVNAAVKSGELVKPAACEKCGEVKPLEGHHSDYTKPLKVEWLCKECHTKAPKARCGCTVPH